MNASRMNAVGIPRRASWVAGRIVLSAALAIPAMALAAAPAAESIGVESLIRLGPGVAPQGLAVAAARVSAAGDPAEHSVAVIWSSQSDLRGRVFGTGGPASGSALDLPDGVGLAVAFGADNEVIVASRPGQLAPEVVVTRFDETGAFQGAETADVSTNDPLAVDFFADGRFAVASAGEFDDAAVMWIFSSEGFEQAATSFEPDASLTGVSISSPRVSVHGDEVLVGWDRLANCSGSGGSGKKCHAALVGRLDDDAVLVKQLRRFASTGPGRTNKTLRFLGGPSDVGSVAVFEDRSARRLITGQPPPSELEFTLPIANGETLAAVAMDDAKGRFLVVTRTTSKNAPVRLFAQGFGRDGQPRTGKVAIDGGRGSSPGSTPRVAAELLADGSAWVAFSRNAGPGPGVYLARLSVIIQ